GGFDRGPRSWRAQIPQNSEIFARVGPHTDHSLLMDPRGSFRPQKNSAGASSGNQPSIRGASAIRTAPIIPMLDAINAKGAVARALRYLWRLRTADLEVHAAHSAAARHRRGGRLLLRHFGGPGFRRDQQTPAPGPVLHARPH